MEEQTSKVFGGCEGPDAMYVKLISSDGHEFIGEWNTGTHTHTTKDLEHWHEIESETKRLENKLNFDILPVHYYLLQLSENMHSRRAP